MLRLTVISGARAGAKLEIAKPLVRFGRAPDNDVVFDANVDLDASAHHAEIRDEGGTWVLHDLNSRNGVFLPQRGMTRIVRHPLPEVEQAQFGPNGPIVQIEIVAERAVQPTAIAGPRTLPISQGVTAVAATVVPPMAPPPPVAPPPTPTPVGSAAPAKMGQQTLLAHVNALVGQRRAKSTLEIKALVDQNVARATGRLRLVIGILVAMVLIAGGSIVYLAHRQSDPEALRRELEELDMKDPRRKDIEEKLAQANPENPDVGRQIYEANKGALFMLVAHRGASYEHGGFCTAFAIKPRLLASNAHCVRAAEEFEDQGADIYAHLNESSKKGKPKMILVSRHKGHPQYKHNSESITPDVGLFELDDEDAPITVSIAETDELKKLGSGDALYVLGFPGRTMDEASPVAVFMFSHIGRITDEFGQRPDDFKDAWLIQHEGQTTPGTSGSPIFDGEGHVVAINAGGLLEGEGPIKQAIYKYAMRVDLLEDVHLGGAPDDADDDDAKQKKKKKQQSGADDDDDKGSKKKKKTSDDD